MAGLGMRLLRHVGLEVKRRKAISLFQTPVHYLHIGKTAGTQIGNVISDVNRHQSRLLIVKNNHRVKLVHLPSDEAYFFSVRDPVARFRSGFYSRKRMGRPRVNRPWSVHEERLFRTFEHANDLAEALFSDGLPGQQAIAGMLAVGHLGETQMEWFQRAGDIFSIRQPVWIIRQHRLQEDLSTLLQRLDIDMPVTLNTDPVRSHANDYTGVPDLSEKAVQNLRQWFHADYAFLRACEGWMEEQVGARRSVE